MSFVFLDFVPVGGRDWLGGLIRCIPVQSGRGHRPRGRGRDHASASKDHDSEPPGSELRRARRRAQIRQGDGVDAAGDVSGVEHGGSRSCRGAAQLDMDASALAGTNGGDAGPPSADSTSVVLNRVHLASTVEQLRDLVVEERPELAEAREICARRGERRHARRRPEARLPLGHGAGAVTLRDLEVDRETVFRVWVQTEAEMEWEMFEARRTRRGASTEPAAARFPISRVATSSMDHHRASSLSLGRGDFRRDCRLGGTRRASSSNDRGTDQEDVASPLGVAAAIDGVELSGLGRSGGVAIAADSGAARRR